MDETTIIVLMMAMFVCMVLIAGGGYYYSTTLGEEDDEQGEDDVDVDDIKEQRKGSCSGMDANAIYEYDENGQCALQRCKDGFFLQSGYCVRQLDTTIPNQSTGQLIPINCEIKSYTKGVCKDNNDIPLSGLSGSCGRGTRQLFPADIVPAKNGGLCDMTPKIEDCEVPCPDICAANDDNYTPYGACISQGKELGDVYCGTGMRSMKLDPTTVTGFTSDEERDDWIAVNWKGCENIKSLPCKVECVQDKVGTECPDLSTSIQRSYVVDGNDNSICFKTEYAQSVLQSGGIVDKSDENILQPVTADEMWDSENGEYKKIPTGKRIAYRTGGGMSFDSMIENGCINYELEDCKAKQIPSQCITHNVTISDCTAESCGEQKYKITQNQVIRPEFGGGFCQYDDTENVEKCEGEFELPCCNANDSEHWTNEVTEYDVFGYGVYNHNNEKCSILNSSDVSYKYTMDKNRASIIPGSCSGIPGIEVISSAGGVSKFNEDGNCGSVEIVVLKSIDSGKYITYVEDTKNVEIEFSSTREPIGFAKIDMGDSQTVFVALPDKNEVNKNDYRLFTIDKLKDTLNYNNYSWNYKYLPKLIELTKINSIRYRFDHDGDGIYSSNDGPEFKIKAINVEDYNGNVDMDKDGIINLNSCLPQHRFKHPDLVQYNDTTMFTAPFVTKDPRFKEFISKNYCVNYFSGTKTNEYNNLIATIKSGT